MGHPSSLCSSSFCDAFSVFEPKLNCPPLLRKDRSFQDHLAAAHASIKKAEDEGSLDILLWESKGPTPLAATCLVEEKRKNLLILMKLRWKLACSVCSCIVGNKAIFKDFKGTYTYILYFKYSGYVLELSNFKGSRCTKLLRHRCDGGWCAINSCFYQLHGGVKVTKDEWNIFFRWAVGWTTHYYPIHGIGISCLVIYLYKKRTIHVR